LPLLTCRGTAFCGRVGASLNNAAGLNALTAENLSDFEAKAIALAKEKNELAALRVRLSENRATMPLFDTDRYRRHIEAAYQTMWEIFTKGEAPTAFAVDAGA
jgi:predicted O-linked N-acetylglucosamine transferase (SPINDLY family)